MLELHEETRLSYYVHEQNETKSIFFNPPTSLLPFPQL